MAETIYIDLKLDPNNINELSSQLNTLTSKVSSSGNASLADAAAILTGTKTKLDTELATGAGSVFELIPSSFDNSLRTAIASINKEMKNLESVDLTKKFNLDSFYEQVSHVAASVENIVEGTKSIQRFSTGASKDQIKTFNRANLSIRSALVDILDSGVGTGNIGSMPFESAFTAFKSSKRNSTAWKKFLDSVVGAAPDRDARSEAILRSIYKLEAPLYQQSDFLDDMIAKSKGHMKKSTVPNDTYYGTFQERLPDEYKTLPYIPEEVDLTKNPLNPKYKTKLNPRQYSQWIKAVRKNEALRKAMIASNYGKYDVSPRGEAGSFFTTDKDNTTIEDLATIAGQLYYNVFQQAAESNVVNYAPLNTTDDKKIRRIANRGSKEVKQAYEAFGLISEITGGLSPLYFKKPTGKTNLTQFAGNIGKPSDDSYIVMSLSEKDFFEGATPQKAVVSYGKRAVDVLPGESAFIALNRSALTDTVGMKGNRSFGNGSGLRNVFEPGNKDMLQNIPMYIIDYSADMMNEDYTINEETQAKIENLFKKNSSLTYRDNVGNLKTYEYAAVTRPVEGKPNGERFVPIGTKSGGVYLVAEDIYKQKSSHYLSTYGTNFYDNWIEDGHSFGSFKDMNKAIEARNRENTPSVPFSEYNAALPDLDKIAVVDLESAFGIDGASFAMPGFIPGGNGTIRMPLLNLKGVMQTWNYKEHIKDALGGVSGPVFVPGLNTPSEILDVYKGIGTPQKLKAIEKSSVYGGEKYADTLRKYFLDITDPKNRTSVLYGNEANAEYRLKEDAPSELRALLSNNKGVLAGRDGLIQKMINNGTFADNERYFYDLKKEDDIRSFYKLGTGENFVFKKNAPFFLKELFSKGLNGQEAINWAMSNNADFQSKMNAQYGIKSSNELFDRFFVDLMNTDMLIADSQIKTSLLEGISGKEANDFIRNRIRTALSKGDTDLLFRLVKTDEELGTDNQLSISTQMAQHLTMSMDQMLQNRKNWEEYIHNLQTGNPEFLKEHIFTSDSYIDKKYRENPTSIETNGAMQTQLAQAIWTAQKAMAQGRIFGRDNMYMAMAGANPGVVLNSVLRGVGIPVARESVAKAFDFDFNQVAGAVKGDQVAGGRYPSAELQEAVLTLKQRAQEIIKKGKYGLSEDVLYLNPETIAAMGGGDFDGDTVQLATGAIVDIFKDTLAEKNKKFNMAGIPTKIDEMISEKQGDDGGPYTITEKAIAALAARQVVASIHMGRISNAQDKLSQINWDDPEMVKKMGMAAPQTRLAYDIDSTFMKTGVLAKLTSEILEVESLGKPLVAAQKKLYDYINNPSEQDNLELLGYNLGSIFSSTNALSMLSMQSNPLSNAAMEKILTNQRKKYGITAKDLQSTSTDDADVAYKKAADMFMRLQLQQLGQGDIISTEDYRTLGGLILHAQNLQQKKKDDAINRKATQPELDEIDERRKVLRSLALKHKWTGSIGFTEENMLQKKGYAAVFNEKYRLTSNQDPFTRSIQQAIDDKFVNDDIASIMASLGVSENGYLNALMGLAYGRPLTKEEIQKEAASKEALQQRLLSMNYSPTAMTNLRKNPLQWYHQNLKRELSDPTKHIQIGNAFHAAAEVWALKRKIQQGDITETEKQRLVDLFNPKDAKTGKQLSVSDIDWTTAKTLDLFKEDEIFKKELTKQYEKKYVNPQTGKIETMKSSFFKLNAKGDIISTDADTQTAKKDEEKANKVLETVGKMDDHFDKSKYTIVAAEERVTGLDNPNILPYLDDANTRRMSVSGRTDLLIRDKASGKLRLIDYKGNITDSGGTKIVDNFQLETYAALLSNRYNADHPGDIVTQADFFSYLDGSMENVPLESTLDKQGETVFKTNKALFEGARNLVNVLGGNDALWNALLKTPGVDVTKFDTPQAVVKELAHLNPAYASALMNSSGLSIGMANKALEKGIVLSDPLLSGASDEQIASLIRAKSVSGKELGREINLQKDISDEEDRIDKLISDLYRRKMQSNPDQKYNPWEAAKRSLDSIETERALLVARGAGVDENKQLNDDLIALDTKHVKAKEVYMNSLSTAATNDMIGITKKLNDDLIALDTKHAKAKEVYMNSLSTAATNDMIGITKKLNDDLVAPSKKTATSQYTAEFESLANSIETATQAYEQLKKEIGQRTLLTSEEKKQYETAENVFNSFGYDEKYTANYKEKREKFNDALDRLKIKKVGDKDLSELISVLNEGTALKDAKKLYTDEYQKALDDKNTAAQTNLKNAGRMYSAAGIEAINRLDEVKKHFKDDLGYTDEDIKTIINEAKTLKGLKEEEVYTPGYLAARKTLDDLDKKYGDRKNMMTKEDMQAYEEASKKISELQNKMQDKLMKESSSIFDMYTTGLSDKTKYGKIGKRVSMDKMVQDFNTALSDEYAQLEKDHSEGYLKGRDDEYNRRKAVLDKINPLDYENLLYKQEFTRGQSQLRSYNRMLSTRGFSFGRRSLYSQMRDQAYAREDTLNANLLQLKDSQDLWQARKAAIEAKYTTTDSATGQTTRDEKALAADAGYQQATSMVLQYGDAIKQTESQLNGFANAHKGITAVVNSVIGSMQNMINMYARQFVRKMISTATQFVKTYDSTMTEIQMVTLKTDSEIASLGESMLQTAEDLKVSFSDVSKVTVELYRQGLDDETIADRSEQILKFSKVTGISASDAIKMMTVAMSSGLVEDSEHVVDAVTVLGDAAATNAQQITKGLQKSLPAAETAGVTYEELNAMLTAITANTQLSGSVAGTTMRNVMSRMTRVKSGDVVYDENGKAMSASSLATTLKSVGIEIVDGVTNQFREIASHWDNLTDMQKNQIAYELGGTQQYSNVVSVIEAFAEKDEVTGESQIDKYLRLQEESEGAVDEKYDVYEESLTAKTTDLSNAFNNLVAAVAGITTEGNAAGSALGFFIDALTFCVEGLEKLAPVITGIIAGLMILSVFTTTGKIALAIMGVGAAVEGISKLATYLEGQKYQKYNEAKKSVQQSIDAKSANDETRNALVEEYAEILNRVKENNYTATDADLEEYNSVKKKLDNMGISIENAATNVEGLGEAAKTADNAINNLKNQMQQKSNEEAVGLVASARNLLVTSEDVVADVNAETEEEAGRKAAAYYRLAYLAGAHAGVNYQNGQLTSDVAWNTLFNGGNDANLDVTNFLIETFQNGAAANMLIGNGKYKGQYLTDEIIKKMTKSEIVQLLLDNDNIFTKVYNEALKNTYGAYETYVGRANEYEASYDYDYDKIFNDYYDSNIWKTVWYPLRGTLDDITKDMEDDKKREYVRSKISHDTLREWADASGNPSQYYLSEPIAKQAKNQEAGDLLLWKAVSSLNNYPDVNTVIGNYSLDNAEVYDKLLGIMKQYVDFNSSEADTGTEEEMTAAKYNREVLIDLVKQILAGYTLDDGTELSDYAANIVDAEIEKMKNDATYVFLQDYVNTDAGGSIQSVNYGAFNQNIAKNRTTYDTKNGVVSSNDETTTPTDILSVAMAAKSSGESFGSILQLLYNSVAANKNNGQRLFEYLNGNQLTEEQKTALSNMLQNEDYQDIATALANLGMIDENGDIVVNPNAKQEDWDNLLKVIAGHSTSLDLFTTQTDKDKRTLASVMLKGLLETSDKSAYWITPEGYNSEAAENMRSAFKEIIGEEDTLKYVNGEMNEYGRYFVGNSISRYGTGIDAFTADELPSIMNGILGDLDGKTPYEQMQYIEQLGSGLNDFLGNTYEGWADYREGVTATARGVKGYDLDKLLDDLKDSIGEEAVKNLYKYEDALEDIVSTVSSLKKGGKDAASAITSLTNSVRTLSNARWALEKYKSGDRSDDVLGALSSSFGYNTEDLENATGMELQSYLSNMDVSLEDQTSDLELQTQSALDTLMDEIMADNPTYDFTAQINADGSYDLSGLIAAMAGLEGDAATEFAAMIQSLASMNASVGFNTTLNGDGSYSVTSSAVNLSKASTAKRSSGGGGGKSAAEKLVDEQKKKKQERDHMLKMIQYRETEYQNADQLTNYGSMLEYENKWREEQIPIIESNIEALKAQLNTVTKGSDDWYTLTQAIMDNEEEIEEHNKAIDENTQKIEENEQAILKLHTDLENTVDTEIKNRIQKERDMNDGTVDMQTTVLDAIKQRYQDEWDQQGPFLSNCWNILKFC